MEKNNQLPENIRVLCDLGDLPVITPTLLHVIRHTCRTKPNLDTYCQGAEYCMIHENETLAGSIQGLSVLIARALNITDATRSQGIENSVLSTANFLYAVLLTAYESKDLAPPVIEDVPATNADDLVIFFGTYSNPKNLRDYITRFDPNMFRLVSDYIPRLAGKNYSEPAACYTAFVMYQAFALDAYQRGQNLVPYERVFGWTGDPSLAITEICTLLSIARSLLSNDSGQQTGMPTRD